MATSSPAQPGPGAAPPATTAANLTAEASPPVHTVEPGTAPSTAAARAGIAPPSAPPAAHHAEAPRRRRPSGEPPPLPRQLNASGWWWLVFVGAAFVLWIVVASDQSAKVAVWIGDNQVLTWVTDRRTPFLTEVMRRAGLLATPGVLLVLWWAAVAVLVIWRRWRHLLIWIGSMLVVKALADVTAELVQKPRPVGVEILGPWEGFSMPSVPMAIVSAFLVNTLYALVPAGRPRNIGKLAVAGLIAITGLSRVYLAQEAPLDVLVAVVVGVAIPLASWRLFAPNAIFPVTYRRGRAAHLDVTGRRHDAIVRAVEDQLGVIPVEIKPFNLAGSGGSTPLRIKVKGDPDSYLFAKLYAQNHLRSDRWYKLGRTLLYGRLEDEKAFNTVRRLVQYEDYLLRVFRDAGLPVPHPYGIVEITPEREYLLVTEFFDGAKEIGEAEVDDRVIDQGLYIVARMWHAGLAHRDIKPANLLVRDGKVLMIDSAFGQVRPSPWRQAVDLGNMLLVLALRTDPARVHARALNVFSVDEVAEAFAATRGLTMPSQLRGMLRREHRDLHEEFISLLPYRPSPIRIQRWSLRRVGLTLCALVVAVLAVIVAIGLLGSPL